MSSSVLDFLILLQNKKKISEVKSIPLFGDMKTSLYFIKGMMSEGFYISVHYGSENSHRFYLGKFIEIRRITDISFEEFLNNIVDPELKKLFVFNLDLFL